MEKNLLKTNESIGRCVLVQYNTVYIVRIWKELPFCLCVRVKLNVRVISGVGGSSLRNCYSLVCCVQRSLESRNWMDLRIVTEGI